MAQRVRVDTAGKSDLSYPAVEQSPNRARSQTSPAVVEKDRLLAAAGFALKLVPTIPLSPECLLGRRTKRDHPLFAALAEDP